ncbi:MAG: alanine--tRNA ligase [Actinomycetota bacterium]|nr:alanine--tRNA ligase [Actinomycetota bacterium]
MDASSLRRAFTEFFVERGHAAVPSAGLIPHHPRAPLFTNAGMNQFLPYVLGEEVPPYPRATAVQKCVRVKGKHDDIENIGVSTRHVTFFEMLGNFSFGDYFKELAIPLAWELSTEVLGLDGDRIWASVHDTDEEAAAIWHEAVGLPVERIQRMGADNFWEMGDTGPCGPCSELYYDRGPEHGEGGGPAHGGEERFVEFWNLVFMQYDRQADGALHPLPRRIIDTGAGFERLLALLQGSTSVFDTEVLRPVVAAAERATGRRYGDDSATDVALRILADHARSVTFLVNDGVFPSNEDRGYVLRRIIRRAVRQAYRLGVETAVTPSLVQATVDVMGGAYPDLVRNRDFVTGVVAREEERFRATLKSGLAILEGELDDDAPLVGGDVAFRLHDTFGFPIDLTREIARERGVDVDLAGFEVAMRQQRERARLAGPGRAQDHADVEVYRELLEQFGTTEFTGYVECESKGRVLAVLPAAEATVEILLDRTPFYAEAGGQVGDTGTIRTDTGRAEVLDTTAALPGLYRHAARVAEGDIVAGQEAVATVDAERREAIRRNHTGTHLLHWALREVLGPHVRQQGSLVGPEYLRFDFSHFGSVTREQLERAESLVNELVLADEPVRAYETSRAHAEQLGAIAFFGDKYGDYVRVVEAGSRSVELCGGTHVGALGMVGPLKVVSEGSIGSNMRRIFALTGRATLELVKDEERLLERAAELLRAEPKEVPAAVERLLQRHRTLEEELKALRTEAATGEARRLAAAAGRYVVARRDGLPADQLRQLALATRAEPGVEAVVLIGSPDGQRVALAAAAAKGAGVEVGPLLGGAARLVGGGGGGKGEVAVAGGKDPSRIDEALAHVRSQLGM